MSKNLVGEHSSNQHENDFFHTTEVRSARIKDSESNPNEFRLIIDKEDADALSFFFKDEAGNEGNHSLEDFIKTIEKQGGEQDGVISYKQANGDEDGLIFKFDSESFDVNDNGDLVITGQRKSLKASDASKKNFDEDDIFGEDYLRLHRQHHKEDFEESEKIQDIRLITDTFSQSDWGDAAQDYHYNITKAVVETIFTSPEYRDYLENAADKAGERSRNQLVANGDINLDEGAEFWGAIGDWFEGAVDTVVGGVTGAVNTVGGFVNDYIVEPITNPQTWKEVGGIINSVGSWSETFFNDKLYPAFSNTLGFFGGMSNWFNDSGATSVTGKISDLFVKDWSAGGSNVSLSLSADLKVNADYSIPKSFYSFWGGDIGQVELTIGVPITAAFKGSVGANNPLTLPLVYNEIPGPSKTLTAPQSGYTAGGQVATKVKYGLDASLTAQGDAGFEVLAGITPVVSLSASSRGVTPNARLEDKYFRKSYSNNFDKITGAGLKAYVTPELEISAGLYVPDYMPMIGGDKVATIGSTLSVPLTLGASRTSYGLFALNSATVSAGVDYSVDAKFLETLSNRNWINPIEYNLASGNIASWSDTMFI